MSSYHFAEIEVMKQLSCRTKQTLSNILGCEDIHDKGIVFAIPAHLNITKLTYRDLLNEDVLICHHYTDPFPNHIIDMHISDGVFLHYMLTIPRNKEYDLELNKLLNRSPDLQWKKHYIYPDGYVFLRDDIYVCYLYIIYEDNSFIFIFFVIRQYCDTFKQLMSRANHENVLITSFIHISMQTISINILNLFISDDHWLLYGILLKRFHINLNQCRELRIHEMNSILHQDMFEIMLEYTNLRMFYNQYKEKRNKYIADELEYIEINNEWKAYIQYTNTVNSILSLMHLKY